MDKDAAMMKTIKSTKDQPRLIQASTLCIALWVALCFGLTSAVYLSWLSRLVILLGDVKADWLSLVAGYLCQAAGLFLIMVLLKKTGVDPGRLFNCSLLLLCVCMPASILGSTAAGVVVFGLLMNGTCGTIAGLYLHVIREKSGSHKSMVFGGGYALATIATGLLALPKEGWLLQGRPALLFFLFLSVILCLVTWRLAPFGRYNDQALWPIRAISQRETEIPQEPAVPSEAKMLLSRRTLILACATVLLASLVKNLGFGFPSSDIASGLNPALLRIPYAAGLIIAGLINDKNRKSGLIFTVAALSSPFIMLSLLDEPISSAVFWGLDYIFFSFFTIFRVVLFLDIAKKTQHPELSPLGLAIGRLGDAAGTALNILLAPHRIALILVAAVLFFLSIILLFILYQQLYETRAVQKKSEQEVFEAFCLHHDLSSRERDILRMITQNHTNGEIANALFISENTVKFHVRNLLQKTGCANRIELQKKYRLALYPHLEKDMELRLVP